MPLARPIDLARIAPSTNLRRRDALIVALVAPLVPKPARSSVVDESAAQRSFEKILPSLCSFAFDADDSRKSSGFVWYADDRDYWIATSARGVRSVSGGVTVAFAGGGAARLTSACEYFADGNADVAFVRVPVDIVEAGGAHPRAASIGTSDDVRVGRGVYAVGLDGGEATLSSGVVSGLNRKIPLEGGGSLRGLIQTDALVSTAASGGPLCDGNGRVIGMCVSSGAGKKEPNGVNFAIPIDAVRFVAEKL